MGLEIYKEDAQIHINDAVETAKHTKRMVMEDKLTKRDVLEKLEKVEKLLEKALFKLSL